MNKLAYIDGISMFCFYMFSLLNQIIFSHLRLFDTGIYSSQHTAHKGSSFTCTGL